MFEIGTQLATSTAMEDRIKVEVNSRSCRFEKLHPIDICAGRLRLALSPEEALRVGRELVHLARSMREVEMPPKRLAAGVWQQGPVRILAVEVGKYSVKDEWKVVNSGTRQEIFRGDQIDAFEAAREFVRANARL